MTSRDEDDIIRSPQQKKSERFTLILPIGFREWVDEHLRVALGAKSASEAFRSAALRLAASLGCEPFEAEACGIHPGEEFVSDPEQASPAIDWSMLPRYAKDLYEVSSIEPRSYRELDDKLTYTMNARAPIRSAPLPVRPSDVHTALGALMAHRLIQQVEICGVQLYRRTQ